MAFDAFLKIEGIEGESTDKTHPGEIEIESFSWGVSNTGQRGSGGGGGAGKAVIQDFHFGDGDEQGLAEPDARLRDRPALPVGDADLPQGGRDQVEFLKIKLTTCLVSSYDLDRRHPSAETSATRRRISSA